MAVQIPFPLPSSGFALNSKMRINLDFLVGQFNQFNTGSATWDTVGIGIANNETGTLTFYNSSNANYLTFQAGATSLNTTFTWPTSAPSTTHKFLTSDTGGIMSWSNLSEKATSYTGNQLLYIDGSQTIQELSVGSGNKVLVNSTPPSFFTLAGTTNQIVVTPTAGFFTFSTPQDIATSSNVTFNRVTSAGGSATNPAVQVIASGASANTGIWSASGTELDFSVAGATRFSLDNTGLGTFTGGMTAPAIRATTSIKLSTSTGSIVTLQALTSSFGDYTLTLPPDDGSVDYVLRTDGSGVLTWVSVASAGGANTALSNVASTAVSASLLPGTDNSIDLGSASKQWANLFVGTNATIVGTTTLGTVLGTIYKSRSTSPSSTGQIRLANGDTIGWRNNAGGGDMTLTTDTSDLLIYSGNLKAQTLTLPTTTNQLILGSTRTVTITAPTPASSGRTVTIPDLSGDYSVVGTIGNQTISGTKTLSGTVNLSGLTISLPLQLDGSKNIVSTAIDLSTSQVTGNLGVSHLNSGTSASSTTFWCGDGSWKSISGGGGATVALDNLASVAVNLALTPGTDNSIALGSSSKQWTSSFLSTSVVISATSNQFVLGATRTVTISAGTPATTSRTWTIPDITADGTFAALQGTQTFTGAKTFSANATFSSATASALVVSSAFVGILTSLTFNTDNTSTSSHARSWVKVGGASAGNAYTNYGIQAVQDWSIGVDNADSDSFKISADNGFPGTHTFMAVTTAGAFTFTGTGSFTSTLGVGGRLTCTAVDAAAVLAQASNSGGAIGMFADNSSNTASSDARFVARVAGTSAGNPFINFNVSGSTQWAIGTDNADSRKFKISQSATLGTNDFLVLDTSGNLTVAGIVRFNGTNSTGAGTALLSTNCPATTLTAPYTWITVKTSDGSTAYIPCWK